MESLRRHVRHACRDLAAKPGLTLTIVLSVGLGIGANTTVFAWLDSIVRHPFPGIPRGNELVVMNVADAQGRVDGMPPVAYPVLEEWRTRVRAFAGIAAHAQTRLNLRISPSAAAEPLWAELVSASFFEAVGVGAWRGRVINADDEADDAAVAVISHAFWQRQLGGATDAIGRSILLNGVAFTVVGIAPPRFTGVVMGLAFDAWVPLWQQPALLPGSEWMRDRTLRRMQAVARLRPARTLAEANHELNRVARDVSQAFGETPPSGAAARWISDTQLGSLMSPLGVAMMALTSLLLLVACSNIAGLLLARSVSRQRSTAIRIALGASRKDLIQQTLVEAVILSGLGCVFGIVLAQVTKGSLLALVPQVALPVSLEIDLNWRVSLFAVTVSILALILFALLPALRGSRLQLVDVLRARSGGARSRLRHGLVIAQVSLSLVSLVVAALFLRSVAAAGRAPLGFGDPRQVLLLSTDLSFTKLRGDELIGLVDEALASVRRLPGVTRAAFSTFVPLGFGGPTRVTSRIDGYVPTPTESLAVARVGVSDGYFETMEIPMVEGRPLDASDRRQGARVVVINEAFARRYWLGKQSVGRRIDQGDGWATIVGVARDAAIDSIIEPPAPLVYHALAQGQPTTLSLHVRTLVDPLTLVEAVRRQLTSVHPELLAMDPGTLAQRMQAVTFVQSVGASVFSVLGAVALLITSVGLFGIAAHAVAERRRELGVRVALGATPGIVARTVVRPTLHIAVTGLTVGTALAIGASLLVRSLLVGVEPIDLPSMIGASGMVVVAAFASAIWPTWRAIREDPVAAIRD